MRISLEHRGSPKWYAYLGIAAVVISYASISISILRSPWFSWTNNALSDLGNTSDPRNLADGVALIFDSSLIISGVLTTIFSILLLRTEHFSWRYGIWTIPLSVASVDLILIGIFNESFGERHYVVSIIFFFVTAVTLLIFAYVSFPLGSPKIGAIALVLGVLCASVWIARWPWSGVAIQETITSLASAVFVVLISLSRIRH